MDASRTNVILGPPGTGKTTHLLSKVEEALSSGVPPNKVAFISFTKKASEEGKTRAVEKFGLQPDDLQFFKTLHALAFRHLGMKRDHMFGWEHIRELGRMLGIEFKGRGEVGDDDVYGMGSADRMLFLEGLARNTKRSLNQIWHEAFEDSINWFELERFSTTLASFKKHRMLSDFTDLLERFRVCDEASIPKFELLVVDEAQDLSSLQWDCVEKLAANSKQIYVAGDDLQGIYQWSGADVSRFINLPGTQTTLDQSYRIPLSVHKLADSLSDRIAKKRPRVWKPRDEVGTVRWFNSMEDVDLSKGTWLLLARNGYMLNDLENMCLEQGFSFSSINRSPLNSPSLTSVRIWENLRKGNEESAEKVLEMSRHMNPRFMRPELIKQLKSDDPGRMYAIQELRKIGLLTEGKWFEVLSRIPVKERDFFIAARRRNETLFKEPRIKISTIHASKGGQADHVLLLTDMSFRCYNNMETNYDDEIRVWYVAATRCRESLNLIMPKTNLNFDI